MGGLVAIAVAIVLAIAVGANARNTLELPSSAWTDGRLRQMPAAVHGWKRAPAPLSFALMLNEPVARTAMTINERLKRIALHATLLAPALLALSLTAAAALSPEERLDDPALEARARALSAGLRCLVCQNQSIDDSNAPLAQDLRAVVRERLLAGDSNDEAIAFITERYGDYVLLRPPVQTNTLLLWGGPAATLALGAVVVAWALRRRAATADAPDPLTPEERRRVDALLGGAGRDLGTDEEAPR